MHEDSLQSMASLQHWSRIRIALLWIYRGRLPAEVSGYMDQFLAMTAWLVLKGKAETTVDGCTQRAMAGEWLFPKPAPRHQKFSSNAEILSIRFRLEWPNGEQLFNAGLGLTLKASEHPELERAAKRMERVVHAVTKTHFRDASLADTKIGFLQHLQLEQAVHLWCGEIYEALTGAGLEPALHQGGDPRIETILEHLDGWPLGEPFRAAELAGQCGLSRSNLERIVVEALGTTSKSYFERRRIEHAMQCLRARCIPVKQIGIEIGFRHPSSFCAWFRHKTGCYPGEMLKRHF